MTHPLAGQGLAAHGQWGLARRFYPPRARVCCALICARFLKSSSVTCQSCFWATLSECPRKADATCPGNTPASSVALLARKFCHNFTPGGDACSLNDLLKLRPQIRVFSVSGDDIFPVPLLPVPTPPLRRKQALEAMFHRGSIRRVSACYL